MYPFITLPILWILIPFGAFALSKSRLGFVAGLLLTAIAGAIGYQIGDFWGFKAIGEEGDYNVYTVFWAIYAYMAFQTHRIQGEKLRAILSALSAIPLLAGMGLSLFVLIGYGLSCAK